MHVKLVQLKTRMTSRNFPIHEDELHWVVNRIITSTRKRLAEAVVKCSVVSGKWSTNIVSAPITTQRGNSMTIQTPAFISWWSHLPRACKQTQAGPTRSLVSDSNFCEAESVGIAQRIAAFDNRVRSCVLIRSVHSTLPMIVLAALMINSCVCLFFRFVWRSSV